MPAGRESGFTLVEAVVALAILGGAGLATMEAAGAQVRGAQRVREAYILAALAQDRLTAAAVLPGAQIHPVADSLARGAFHAPFEAYRWTAESELLVVQPALYRLQVTIQGPHGQYDIETLLHQ